MITRLTGKLSSVEALTAIVEPQGVPAFACEVLLPAYLVEKLAPRVGQTVTLVTLHYLESQGQGTSFIPRLIGFMSLRDRDFFELFTTVKGIGNRKALRAMSAEPARIAGAILSKDARALQELPEIGRRLAETMIAELSGKVEPYLGEGEASRLDAAAAGRVAPRSSNPGADAAIAALVALGETTAEAERLVGRALERAAQEGRTPGTPDEVLHLVYASR